LNKYTKSDASRPDMIALVQALQVETWFTEPEAIEFEMLCYLVNDWRGAFLYYMPRGYDSRWWNATAEANRRIAAYEDFIYTGKPGKNFKIQPLTPLPSPNLPVFWAEGGNFLQKVPMLKNAAIIQGKEFILGNKRLVAVGNFWQKGECFFTLALNELDPHEKYVVCQPVLNRCFSPDNQRKYWTGEELAAGILLHAGALRWAFYVIEPYLPETEYGTTVTQQFINSEMNRRLPEIKKALEWEKNYHNDLNAATKKN